MKSTTGALKENFVVMVTPKQQDYLFLVRVSAVSLQCMYL